MFGIVIALQASHVKSHALGHTVVIWNMVSGGWYKQFCSLVLECSSGMQIRSFAHGVVEAKLSNKCTHNCSLHKSWFVFESVIVVLVVLFNMFPSFHSLALRGKLCRWECEDAKRNDRLKASTVFMRWNVLFHSHFSYWWVVVYHVDYELEWIQCGLFMVVLFFWCCVCERCLGFSCNCLRSLEGACCHGVCVWADFVWTW